MVNGTELVFRKLDEGNEDEDEETVEHDQAVDEEPSTVLGRPEEPMEGLPLVEHEIIIHDDD